MKKYLFAFGFIAVAGLTIGIMMYNKPHQNIVKTKSDFQLSATELFTTYEADETQANASYMDKLIEVSGIVQEVKKENNTTILVLDGGSMMFGVSCELDPHSEHKRTEFKIGENIILKGKCTGMLMDVVMVRCVEVS